MLLILVALAHASSFLESSLGSYNEDLAYKLWMHCAASYCGDAKIKNWSCHKPCEVTAPLQDIKIFYNSSSENAGYSAYNPSTNQIILVFRGTVPWQIKNWMEDIDFIKTDYPYCNNGCQVHRGFYQSFQTIQDQVLNNVRSLKNAHGSAQIVITGHSLGGALATHALVLLKQNGFTATHFYTFGSPRVGDFNFFSWLSKSVFPAEKFRVTHAHDPVPHLPLNSWGFNHINTEAYYKQVLFIKWDVKICNDSTGEDPNCSNSNIVDLAITDHSSYMGYDISVEILTCQ